MNNVKTVVIDGLNHKIGAHKLAYIDVAGEWLKSTKSYDEVMRRIEKKYSKQGK